MSYHYTTKSAYVPPYVPYSPIAVSNDNRTIYVHTGLFRWSDTVVGVSSFEKNPTKFHNYLLYWLHEEYSFFIVINKIFFFFCIPVGPFYFIVIVAVSGRRRRRRTLLVFPCIAMFRRYSMYVVTVRESRILKMYVYRVCSTKTSNSPNGGPSKSVRKYK